MVSPVAAVPPDEHRPKRLGGLDPAALMAQGLGSPDAEEADFVATKIPGYQLLERLGKGGMGEVFLARQLSLDREVAVKWVRRELVEQEWFLERLEREAQLLAGLRHPHLVTVHDFIRLEDGTAAVIMELVEGGSLREMLRATPQGLPLAQVLRFGREIASALVVAHTAGVIHRDVKPENVLIDANGHARVADFGMALPMGEGSGAIRYTKTGAAAGTPGYLPPEQLKGGPTDHRGDIFAFGVLFYEMLTGQLPLGHFTPPRKLRPELSMSLEAVLLQSLKPEPADRPADMKEWLRVFDGNGSNGRSGVGPFRPLARISRRAAVLGGLAAGLAGGGAWFGLQKRKPDVAWNLLEWPDDPGMATIQGGWRREGRALLSDESICLIGLAQEMPDAYDLRLTFRRLGGEESIGVFFKHWTGHGSCELDGWSRHASGIQEIGGRTFQFTGGFEFEVVPDRDYELGLELRHQLARVFVDGEAKGVYNLGEPLSITAPWAWMPGESAPALAIGSWKSPTIFHQLTWRDRTT